MKVIFQREDGGKIFESYDEDINNLLAILKETKGIKIGMVEYEVLKYELEYFRNPKKAVTERELHIIVQPKYI
ncbi:MULTISPECIES: hypothetical protein [Bacillus]|uniref:Group-specific protein n=4 Tax=Bacillus cereus group TaxID=86661 RepID=A0A1J9YGU4_9BACI|nr:MULTISPECIES: hypothetical protein [Bacillus]AAS41278.1 hypothetical protein BCE_2360 [Bacillus cereus ATCC 10987]ADY21617.1 hypothetical protein YBT020_11895 [Bacillus thuringiensis serovar finitimus YBT-020]AFQ12519.1 hypothetical protein BCK_23205 [Bacillus cereus FRI-35]ASI77843.1 hypothetical protein BA202_11550 [Bacillus cereus]EEK44982.1 hypothetical protein bcere0001_21100 [Bacillus cereus m1293]EJR49635.1 hypothetical protein IIK_02490 [Bacillus cereus VD102]MRC70101.1 hypothetic